MEPTEAPIPCEYDNDTQVLRDKYNEMYDMLKNDPDISMFEFNDRVRELNTWYEVEEDQLLQGDSKSAKMLIAMGLADYVQP